ncbi:MAG: sulfatase [Tannerellaceae bacterium]|nr:sulfatase [Tannerellaceae bacterium]
MNDTSTFLNRRRYYLFPCLSSGLFVAVSLAGQTNVAPDKPNILVFVADDAGMDFGCYGNSVIKTPNIDRLASQGLQFQNAFLTAPQSSPSRTSMMAGMFAHTIGTEDLHTPIDDQTRIMPAYFKEGGYHTGTMLKKHWGENGDKQFDSVITDLSSPYELDLTEEKYNEYTKFLDQATGHPFFLWVGFNDPHRPYDREVCPQENDPSLRPVPPSLVDGPDTRRDLADYYDEITRMDKNIGRMVGELEKRGLMENTIIVFLSDNGMPFPRCKGSLYDSGIQTPLIFVWKDKIEVECVHSNGLISSVDLAATLLDCAGVSKPENMYGESFKEILLDPSLRGREYIFAERNWHDTDEYIRCIRTERYKLIYNAYYELPHGTATDLSTSLS